LCVDEEQYGPVPSFAISRVSAKNLKVMRPHLVQYLPTREEFEQWTAERFDFVINDEVNEMNVRIHYIYPLAEVARAHTDLGGRTTGCKLLLKP
jgi:NADPH2:quinone reductase